MRREVIHRLWNGEGTEVHRWVVEPDLERRWQDCSPEKCKQEVGILQG